VKQLKIFSIILFCLYTLHSNLCIQYPGTVLLNKLLRAKLPFVSVQFTLATSVQLGCDSSINSPFYKPGNGFDIKINELRYLALADAKKLNTYLKRGMAAG